MSNVHDPRFFHSLSVQGVPQNDREAAKWYRRAAEQGHADAQYHLGLRYATGRGVPQNDREAAAKWYRRAAEQGHVSAQVNLGVMYFEGRGVPQDYKEAYAWFNAAAAQGDKDAARNRDLAARRLDPKALSEAQALSRTYYENYR